MVFEHGQSKGRIVEEPNRTNVPSTNKQNLEKVEIPELDISKQMLITEIQQLYRKEKRLYQHLMAEKDKFYKAVTHSVIKMIER
ncbi:hypothetical protein GCM10027018_19780 [Paenibacillus thermoaerophilus]